MKKFLSFILCLCLALTLVGCEIAESVSEIVEESKKKNPLEDRIVRILYTSDEVIYVDTETKVMYLYVSGGYDGGLTVMLDENGAPLLWEDPEAEK